MTQLPQSPGEIAHRRKKGTDFLDMMFDITGFLQDFHQHIGYVFFLFFKPCMVRIELVAQDKAHSFWRGHLIAAFLLDALLGRVIC
jgi:hypothetical protein